MERTLNAKIVSISPKRQITIPQTFFKMFNFGTEAKITPRKGGIFVEPTTGRGDVEFVVEILKDLVNQGFGGQDLIAAFQDRQAKIRPAVEAMLAEAGKIARGEAEYGTLEDAFEVPSSSCFWRGQGKTSTNS